jgi:hypothetical protein
MTEGILRPWRHLPLRCPASGPADGSPGPGRCDSDPALTGTMWHSSRLPVPPGPAWRPGCARSRSRPALPSPAGNSLQKSHTHAASMPSQLAAGRHGSGLIKALERTGTGVSWRSGWPGVPAGPGLARRTRTVMLLAPVCPESGCEIAPPGRGPLANRPPRTSLRVILAGSRHRAIRPAERQFTTVDDTLLDKKVINP